MIAVGVRTRDNPPAQRKANWLRPPTGIPRGSFTPWMKPDYVEPEGASQSAQWLLLNGKPLPAGESVAQDAPRVRFALLTPGPSTKLVSERTACAQAVRCNSRASRGRPTHCQKSGT